jgi:hypothetical protein
VGYPRESIAKVSSGFTDPSILFPLCLISPQTYSLHFSCIKKDGFHSISGAVLRDPKWSKR